MRNLCFLIAAGALLCLTAPARADVINGISVVVNDSVVTYAEIQNGIIPQLETLARRYQAQPDVFEKEAQKVRDEEIEALVERKLILHEFIAGGYSTNVLEAFIDDRMKETIQKNFYGDRARLIKTLQAEGMTYEMYRRQEREKFILEYMTYHNANLQKVLISPLRIERYYNEHKDEFKVDDQVKLRMIVVGQPANGPPGTARKIAHEILDKIESGVPFAEMATVYSSGSQRANGGDRGWVDRTYFKPELAKAAFSLTAGQHSGVIELPEASYLVMVEDARPSHVRPLSEVHSEIEQKLKLQEARRLRDRWIERLKNKSFIEFY
jgi:parvulin-like peptidyl-prolyl isomerase